MAPAMPEIGAADQRFARDAWIRALERIKALEREPELSMPLLIGRLAEQFGSTPALIAGDGSLSFRQLHMRCNQYARWGLAQGLAAGDTAALIMPNRAEYLAAWLGLTRIAVSVALINTNLAGEALLHSLTIVAPKVVIVEAELALHLSGVRERLPMGVACWVYGQSTEDFAPLRPAIDDADGGAIAARECSSPSLDATALYIYTSGTTGLPKAARVSHYRLLRWSYWFAGLLDTGPADRMYNCLPLYHSVGGVVAIGATLAGGGAVVIRPQFSAGEFWRDVCAERCSLFQYVGELCRYLVNSPRQPQETEHVLRIACGNGLRPEVWQAFQQRFRIPRIIEYYASTEGNFSLYNCEGKPGAIGRIPSFLAHRLPVALVRFDVERGEPLRNDSGFCERCAVDEVGEALGQIPTDDRDRAGRFEGYADPESSERKLLRNVFTEGDAWYRTGDLMRRDEQGFFYFVDRIGDTYRWKGENVSTAEVISALSAAAGVLDGVVYGVAVPGTEGRAGMAALVTSPDFDLVRFRADIAQRLPGYARPVFLRLLPALEATGTYKPRKHELQQAGFDPARIADPLYVDDARAGAYVPLDATRLESIVDGRMRL